MWNTFLIQVLTSNKKQIFSRTPGRFGHLTMAKTNTLLVFPSVDWYSVVNSTWKNFQFTPKMHKGLFTNYVIKNEDVYGKLNNDGRMIDHVYGPEPS